VRCFVLGMMESSVGVGVGLGFGERGSEVIRRSESETRALGAMRGGRRAWHCLAFAWSLAKTE
jgi:hypothetical protein